MNHRNFASVTEGLARQWFDEIETSDQWNIGERVSSDPNKPKTESDPYYAYCGPLKCIAKPNSPQKPRAAIEKIVSDLAYHLGLPVMPAILWDRGAGQQADRHMVLAAYAFEPNYTWQEAEPRLTEPEKLGTAPVFSAVSVFETWISAQDRDANKHVLVNVGHQGGVQMVFIDYAYSLCHTWDAKGHNSAVAPSSFPTGGNEAAMREMADKIAAIDVATINDLVGRVPLSYLPQDKREIILENLLSRRQTLKTMLGI